METKFRSLITTFGGAIKFAAPVKLHTTGARLLGAGMRGGQRLVHLVTPTAAGGTDDSYKPFTSLPETLQEDILMVLKKFLQDHPEAIRIRIGDLVKVSRLEDPFYGVIADTGGVAIHVDTRGTLVSDIPVIVLFGVDDYEVVGHKEFSKGLFDLESPQEAYDELLFLVQSGKPVPPFWARHKAFSGESALEKAVGAASAKDWSMMSGLKACIMEYKGIEALVYATPDGKPTLHPTYGWEETVDGVPVVRTAKGR